jgi:para-nitrobenzyl esterase
MTDTQVRLPDGIVEGRTDGNVRSYFSIPYAAPLTDARRFREPQPVERWEGVRDATKPGASAPQNRPPPVAEVDISALDGIMPAGGPDYLTLNVFAAESGGPKRPVMLFIHGGSFVAGSKDVPIYDGSCLARDGVVCVVINYRVGIEGFLPIPGVPTNLGLRDMIEALRWVRDNIAAFDGDPDNVTLFGESGGAWCIAMLMTSPLAQPLFRRAICQSGHILGSRDNAILQRLVRRLARKLGIKPTRDAFIAVPRDKLLRAQEWVMKPSLLFDMRDKEGRDPSFGITRFLPVHGDDVLPQFTLDALKQGAGQQIDLLIGTTSEEANLFFVPGGIGDKLKRWQALLFMKKALPKAREALRAYGLDRSGARVGDVLTRALTDLMFRWMVRRTAELHHGRSYVYEFEWRSPAVDGRLGAAHAVELPFVFGTLAVASGPRGLLGETPPQKLSDSIRALWVRFATDGTLPWPEYKAETRLVYSLSRETAAHEPVMPAAAFLP